MPPPPPPFSLPSLTLLGLIQAFALLVFMCGFFLTRQEVPHHSHCQDAALWEIPSPSLMNASSSSSSCWSTPRYRKAVIVVIDALRFDFVNPYHDDQDDIDTHTDTHAKRRKKQPPSPQHHHLNKLPLIRELLHHDPSRALLYRFEADPPTTTMQRLKGLTTGSLPTFLDFRQNFHSPAIMEDNLIHQLRQAGKRITAMGDDTWQLLFPEGFDRSFPFPSFNTRDLDSVDEGVLKHLLPEMKKNYTQTHKGAEEEGEWDVLIAHFLGVDHVGHTFGPSHPAMEEKLAQMDKALRGVVEVLQQQEKEDGEETILLLMGDHGMTDDGNHGGATVEETEAALFIYSPGKPLVATHIDTHTDTPTQEIYLWRDADGRKQGLHPHTLQGGAVPRRVAQVDLVPTLSLLLGVAVPYPNLGSIIPELFYTHTHPQTPTHTHDHSALAWAFYANAHQLNRYLQKYAELASLPGGELEMLTAMYEAAVEVHKKGLSVVADTDIDTHTDTQRDHEDREGKRERVLEEACRLYRLFLTEALQLGRRVWTQYDVGLMVWGCVLLGVSLWWVLSSLLFSSFGFRRERREKKGGEGAGGEMERAAAAAPAAPAAAAGEGEEEGEGGGGGDALAQSPTRRRTSARQPTHTHPHTYTTHTHTPHNPMTWWWWALGAVLVALLCCWLFPAHFLQQGNDHAFTAIPSLILTLLLGGLTLSRWWCVCVDVRVIFSSGDGGENVSFADVVCGMLVVLHGVSLFSNSYIEGEEKVYVFLAASAMAVVWVGQQLQQQQQQQGGQEEGEMSNSINDKDTLLSSSFSSLSSSLSFSSSPLPLPTWLLPALLLRLAFETKGHGQDVAAHFHFLLTLLPLLALLAGYHHLLLSSTPTHTHTHTRTALLALSYLLLFVHWLAAVDPQDAPFWSDSLQLGLPRVVYVCACVSLLVCIFSYGYEKSESESESESENGGAAAAVFCLDVAAVLSPVLLLVLGPLGPWSLLCMGGSVCALQSISQNNSNKNNKNSKKEQAHTSTSSSQDTPSSPPPSSSFTFAHLVTLSFLGRAFFFATGHHSQFNRLQYSAAFVGFDEFDFVRGGCLLFLNTFGTELWTVLWVGYCVLSWCSSSCASSLSERKEKKGKGKGKELRQDYTHPPQHPQQQQPMQVLTHAFATFVSLSAFKTLLTTLCVLLQRRHLMVWAIFAPKFIFDAALHLVLYMTCLLLLWTVWWGEGRRMKRRKMEEKRNKMR